MNVTRPLRNVARHASVLVDASRGGNLRVLRTLAGPAVRGFVLERGKSGRETRMAAQGDACFTWDYQRDHPALAKLYRAARRNQWDADEDLDWSQHVDPVDPKRPLYKGEDTPLVEMPGWHEIDAQGQANQLRDLLAWMLSQFLHGEQGALFVACQLVEAVGWTDAKLYGATQVMDEGRHVEVFNRYLTTKLQKRYVIDDNLYVVLDALMSDRRWDLKFLGMQILVEGLALGAFATLRHTAHDPLMKELLRLVIMDESRHVHFGVVALEEQCRKGLTESERREREDWAFEMCLLLRNRFLAHEFYDEHWAHRMSRRQWDKRMLESAYMRRFRTSVFRRIVPNLRRIGLMTNRVRPHYEAIGLLQWEHAKAAPDLSAEELLAEA